MVEVYRFRTYSGQTDEWKTSLRWGTLSGIEKISGDPIRSCKAVIDQRFIDSDGLTEKGFVPEPTNESIGFQRHIRY